MRAVFFRFPAVGLSILLIILLAACGKESNSSTSGVVNLSQGEETTLPSDEDEPFNLDLKTASEVMEYVRTMEPSQRREVLLAGARKEGGTIVHYTPMNEANAKQLHDAFHQSFPDLTLEVWRGDGNDQVYTRAVNEFRAGNHKVDVINNKFNYSYDFNKEGMLTPYFAPNRADFPKGMHDPDGLWTALYTIPVVAAWNTDLMTEDEMPKTWHDLADPKYENRFSIDVQETLTLFYMRKRFGEKEGTELAEKIAANKPRMIRSRSQQTALLSAGEFDFAPMIYEHNAIQMMNKGGPINYKFLEGPILVDMEASMLVNNAPHPYGAILFIDWFTSEEGQQVIADMGRRAGLPGMKYKDPQLEIDIFREHELFELKPEEFGPVLEQTYSDFKRIFGLTQ